MPAARPSGAGQREPPERQRRWRRRRRQQHPPLSVPALGVAAAGRHECYYIERRCRSIALSQWQGATGLILRAVRGVHLSPAASLRPPPPPPGPTAAPVWARVGARGERDAPQRSAAAAEGQGLEGHRGRAAERPETEKWETPVRWGRRGKCRDTEISCLAVGEGGGDDGGGGNKLIIQHEKPSACNCRVSRQVPAAASLLR